MCFSAEASFAAGAALIVMGVPTLRMARGVSPRLTALAALPLFFGVQQLSEGVVWASLDAGEPSANAALVFLFFAYWFWPTWVPFASALIEPKETRRKLFLGLSAFGCALGLILFVPVVVDPSALKIEVIQHSIRYKLPGMFDSDVTRNAARAVYASVVCLSLVASSHAQVRRFGALIFTSVVAGFAFAAYAFTSVWCFLAAILSAYILYVVVSLRRASPERPEFP